ncbi:MAG: hypothetical protein IIZ27_00380 [Solobacterium sp.]|nr:hypothetical protein [Solobacterium sp.]
MNRIVKIIAIALLIIMAAIGFLVIKNTFIVPGDNSPYDPGTPAPAPHDGVFTSEHGTMTFNGDDETIIVNFDDTLADLIGISAGEHEMKYEFLSGDLPPHGSVPIRYDVAHELSIYTDEDRHIIQVGIASDDGKTVTVGTDMVTEERIPLLFRDDRRSFSVIFYK